MGVFKKLQSHVEMTMGHGCIELKTSYSVCRDLHVQVFLSSCSEVVDTVTTTGQVIY